MLSFLLFIIIFVLVIGLLIISSIFGFIRSIFSFGKRKNPVQSEENTQQTSSKSKIFEKTEGEYVDYEEIK